MNHTEFAVPQAVSSVHVGSHVAPWLSCVVACVGFQISFLSSYHASAGVVENSMRIPILGVISDEFIRTDNAKLVTLEQ